MISSWKCRPRNSVGLFRLTESPYQTRPPRLQPGCNQPTWPALRIIQWDAHTSLNFQITQPASVGKVSRPPSCTCTDSPPPPPGSPPAETRRGPPLAFYEGRQGPDSFGFAFDEFADIHAFRAEDFPQLIHQCRKNSAPIVSDTCLASLRKRCHSLPDCGMDFGGGLEIIRLIPIC